LLLNVSVVKFALESIGKILAINMAVENRIATK